MILFQFCYHFLLVAYLSVQPVYLVFEEFALLGLKLIRNFELSYSAKVGLIWNVVRYTEVKGSGVDVKQLILWLGYLPDWLFDHLWRLPLLNNYRGCSHLIFYLFHLWLWRRLLRGLSHVLNLHVIGSLLLLSVRQHHPFRYFFLNSH